MAIPQKALMQHIGVVGKTGSGKTYTAKGIVEGLLAEGRRVCIIDPTGVWWGLRTSDDGKHEGFPVVVLGGDEGDLSITEDSGEAAARAIANSNLPSIIDLSLFTMGERRRFLEAFLKTLHTENRQPLHLILDEADEMASQNPLPEMKRVFHEVDRIVRRGRIRGFRVMFITQRPAVLHKNILTQANTLIAMRLTAPQDRKAIEEWIKGQGDAGAGAKVLASLAKLSVGEGWVWAPEEDILKRTKFPMISTYDSGRTPEDDEEFIEPVTRATVDLSALQLALDAKPEKPAAAGSGVDVQKIEAAAQQKGYQQGWREANAAWQKKVSALLDAVETQTDALVDKLPNPPAPTPAAKAKRKTSTARPPSGANPLVAAAERIWPIKLTWSALCATVGRKARGGHFNSQRKAALDGGLLREENGLVVLCDPPSGTGEKPADLLEQNLPGSARDMFVSLRAKPAPSWEAVTDRLGRKATGGHFNAGRKMLLDNNFVIADSKGLRVAPELL